MTISDFRLAINTLKFRKSDAEIPKDSRPFLIVWLLGLMSYFFIVQSYLQRDYAEIALVEATDR